ncbi:hypothetical protein M8818_006481 [Zalaria obscura]|uniref:Uncharacterized protein n=1 Tax=Zalaria obscura TaxID=2024903 RepID=A0ACC3SAA2_9PEZI
MEKHRHGDRVRAKRDISLSVMKTLRPSDVEAPLPRNSRKAGVVREVPSAEAIPHQIRYRTSRARDERPSNPATKRLTTTPSPVQPNNPSKCLPEGASDSTMGREC